jgi:hypothetical protein
VRANGLSEVVRWEDETFFKMRENKGEVKQQVSHIKAKV